MQRTRASASTASARPACAVLALVLVVSVLWGATRLGWAAADAPPPTPAASAPRAAATSAGAPAVVRPAGAGGASVSPTSGSAMRAPARPSPLAKPRPAASPQPDERAALINFLGETIAWYRQITTEERIAAEPAETLFLSDDRQMALEIVQLAFQYARAHAALLKTEKHTETSPSIQANAATPGKSNNEALPGLVALMARAQEQQNNLNRFKQQADQLKAGIVSAKGSRRAELARQLEFVRSQMELTQARLDSYNALIQFETAAGAVGSHGSALADQIDALEHSVPQVGEPAKAVPLVGQREPTADVAARMANVAAPSSDTGLLSPIETLITLEREQSALTGRINQTHHLLAVSAAARAPLIARLRALNDRVDELAAQSASDDLAANRARKQQFDDLIKRHKAIVDALVPLAKQDVFLHIYLASLQRWSDAVDQRSDDQFRLLIIRLSALGVMLLAIFVAAFVWRSLTFRYVQDLRRRRQLLQLRKLTIALVVGLVLIFDFANQLGTLATVMGLAAAGVALALQNVILSFAGYFFVTGRYGIRVGDRIQIAGISGDVIDIGLFKLALMELVGDGNSRQPTGRVVVFPNSIVFQTNGNFFKQAPGTNFVWNEFRLTLSPECDYRLAEKRLLEVVEDVYARYRDTVQRQYHELERDLSMKFESPRPQSRLRLGPNGIELTIRYPADTRYAVQVADEISRRALDAIAKDPALALAMPGTPNLSPLARPPVAEAGASSPAGTTGDGREALPPQAEAVAPGTMVPAAAEVRVEPPSPEAPPPEPRAPGKD
jgi:small-conductance mechanosensitive channel